MPFTQSGIAFKVLSRQGDWSESWTPQLVNNSFVAQVAWYDANQFLIDMLGDHIQINGAISRSIPEQHPFYPAMYCVGCELVETQGTVIDDVDVPGMPAWEYAVYRCMFANLPYDVLTDEQAAFEADQEISRYVERVPKSSGETVQTMGQFEFTSDNSPLLTPPAIHLPYEELIYVWHLVPGPIESLRAKWAAYYGKVNDGLFDNQYAAETCLFLAPETQRVISTPGQNILYNITYRFLYRPQTWNKVYRGTGTEDFESVVNTATGNPPYANFDFTELWNLT